MTTEYFEVVTIELPYVSGVCTVPDGKDWAQGYHTPVTCKESSDSTWVYYFGTNVPISVNELEAGHPIYRKIKSISESTPTLQPDGMASRGSLTVSFTDFPGDPGPVNKTETGTYFSKLAARNFMSGREVKIYRYTREDGVNTLVSSSSYLSETFKVNGSGVYTLSCSSRLDRTYKDYTQFPTPTGATLRADIDSAATAIPVFDGDYDWATLPVIRIGDDFLTSISYDSPTQVLTVQPRTYGVKNALGESISRTVSDDHDAGDDIQVCYVSDKQEIADFLELQLVSSEVPASYIDTAAWQAEFDDYWGGSKITNVWSEPTSVQEHIEMLSENYLLDIWEESVSPSKVKVSAVSIWKQPSKTIEIGRGITESTFTYSGNASLRASRAYAYYDKPFKSEDDDRGNFKKLAINKDLTYEGADFYGSVKEKELTSSPILDTNDASLLTQRYVARYSLEPVNYSWDCEEKYLDYATGDIVELQNQDLQDAEGNPAIVRAQITNVTPKYKYKGLGRAYSVKALTYLPAVISGGTGEFTKVITNSTIQEIDIHNDYADRTATVVDFTLILDNCSVASSDTAIPSIRNGGFATGSTVTIICVNGTDFQGAAGAGGNGARWFYEAEFEPSPWFGFPATDGKQGGICFNADGIDTDIYLSGATGNATYPTANGFLRAPGGGGGGSSGFTDGDPGDGGGGGAGNAFGLGGAAGTSRDNLNRLTYGEIGQNGNTIGSGGTGVDGGDGGGWGDPGLDGLGINEGLGGLAGSGIIKSGASVIMHGDTPTNFINGNGDTPD